MRLIRESSSSQCLRNECTSSGGRLAIETATCGMHPLPRIRFLIRSVICLPDLPGPRGLAHCIVGA
jgi:hypothetical protein